MIAFTIRTQIAWNKSSIIRNESRKNKEKNVENPQNKILKYALERCENVNERTEKSEEKKAKNI